MIRRWLPYPLLSILLLLIWLLFNQSIAPGTIWVSHDSSASILLIHVLDLVDEQGWIDSIKRRYERPLLEIFQ